jgi:hypothetical protein
MDPFTIASFGLQAFGAASDIINGGRARKASQRRFLQFQADLARREQQTTALERIARGEIRVGLDEGKQLFKDALQAVAASGNAGVRRSIEDGAVRDAQSRLAMRRQGMQGGSALATSQALTEQERFRAQLDASANRSGALAQLLTSQAAFSQQGAMAMADSLRREAAIGAQAGQELRGALENTTTEFNPIAPALGGLAGSLSTIRNRMQMEQALNKMLAGGGSQTQQELASLGASDLLGSRSGGIA